MHGLTRLLDRVRDGLQRGGCICSRLGWLRAERCRCRSHREDALQLCHPRHSGRELVNLPGIQLICSDLFRQSLKQSVHARGSPFQHSPDSLRRCVSSSFSSSESGSLVFPDDVQRVRSLSKALCVGLAGSCGFHRVLAGVLRCESVDRHGQILRPACRSWQGQIRSIEALFCP